MDMACMPRRAIVAPVNIMAGSNAATVIPIYHLVID